MKHRYTLKRVLKVLDTLEAKFPESFQTILGSDNAVEVRKILGVSSTHRSAERGRWVIVNANTDEIWLMTMVPDLSEGAETCWPMQFKTPGQAQEFIDRNWDFWLKFKQSYLAFRLL